MYSANKELQTNKLCVTCLHLLHSQILPIEVFITFNNRSISSLSYGTLLYKVSNFFANTPAIFSSPCMPSTVYHTDIRYFYNLKSDIDTNTDIQYAIN